VMLPWQDVTEAQDVRANGSSFFSDGMSRLLVPPPLPPPSFPSLLQIYNQTDGSYMGSPEMSPLYSIVNALTQTAATIILSPFPFVVHSPLFLSSCLPSSLDQSLFLPLRLPASYPVSVSHGTNVPTHTLTRHEQSLTGVKLSHFETPTLSPLLRLLYNAQHSSLVGESHQMNAISLKSCVRVYALGVREPDT